MEDSEIVWDKLPRALRPGVGEVLFWKFATFVVTDVTTTILSWAIRSAVLSILRGSFGVAGQSLINAGNVMLFVFWVFILVCSFVVMSGATIIPYNTALVTLTFGKFRKVHKAGYAWTLPVLERWVKFVDLRTKTRGVTANQALTSDNIPVDASANIFFRVFDPLKSVFLTDDIEALLLAQAEIATKDLLSGWSVMALNDQQVRQEASVTLLDKLSSKMEPFGVQVSDARFSDIVVTDEKVQDSIIRQLRAELEKSARVTEAEADTSVNKTLIDLIERYLPDLTPQEKASMMLSLRKEQTKQSFSGSSNVLPVLNLSQDENNPSLGINPILGE